MTKPSPLTVSLTPELEAFVETRIASGRFGTAGEVVREGLRLLEAREQAREVVVDDLRRQIEVGVAQAQNGELRDGRAVFQELRCKILPES